MNELLKEIRITAIAIALLLLVGWFTTSKSCSSAKRTATDTSVADLASRLDAQVERGRYQRIETKSVSEHDAWGRTLRVEYRDEGVGEKLTVQSAGSDGAFDTKDDVVATRWLMNAKGIGESVTDGAAGVAKQATKGMIRGIKEELKETLKRKEKADEAATSEESK